MALLTSISLMSVGLGANHSHRWENASLQFGLDYTDLAPYQALFPNQIDWNRSPHGYNGQLVRSVFSNMPGISGKRHFDVWRADQRGTSRF